MALFFYKDGEYCQGLARELLKVYEVCGGVSFEIVLVYLHFTEFPRDMDNGILFQNVFKSMPWLALPFKDPRVRKLWRIFLSPHEPGDLRRDDPKEVANLIIFGPEGNYLDKHGAEILTRYSICAYPFTAEKVADLEVEDLKKYTLDYLLRIPGYLIRGSNHSQVIYYGIILILDIIKFQLSIVSVFQQCC